MQCIKNNPLNWGGPDSKGKPSIKRGLGKRTATSLLTSRVNRNSLGESPSIPRRSSGVSRSEEERRGGGLGLP